MSRKLDAALLLLQHSVQYTTLYYYYQQFCKQQLVTTQQTLRYAVRVMHAVLQVCSGTAQSE
jgi:hypothetical protein